MYKRKITFLKVQNITLFEMRLTLTCKVLYRSKHEELFQSRKQLVLYLMEMSKLLIKFDDIYLLFWKRATDQFMNKITDCLIQTFTWPGEWVVKNVDKIWWYFSFILKTCNRSVSLCPKQ